MKRHFLAGSALVLSALLLSGCGLISGDPKIDEGVVIAPKLKIRSTTAPAALDLAEVKRGDRLDILEQAQFKTPTRTVEWYKVRTKDKSAVEGWVETRYVINKSVVDKMNALFEKSQALPSQGTGHLKVQTRLRQEADGDVVTYLSRGTPVEIVGKARTTYKPDKQTDDDNADDTDVVPTPGQTASTSSGVAKVYSRGPTQLPRVRPPFHNCPVITLVGQT
jgi:hypothetical protein